MTTSGKQDIQQLSEQLLEAHIRFIRQRLIDSSEHVEKLIDFALQQAEHIHLNEAVNVNSVKEVVRVYAFDLNLGSGMLELIGLMAQRIYTEMSTRAPTLSQLIRQRLIEQWIDKILELEEVRLRIIAAIQQSQTAHDVIVQVAASLIKKQLPEILQTPTEWLSYSNRLASSLSGKLSSKLLGVLAQQEEKLLELAEQRIATFVQAQSGHLLTLDSSELKDIAMQVWHSIKDLPFDQLLTGVDALDVEEFFVLVYEQWKHLRKTDYLQHLIETGIDVFFEVYGEYPVATMLDEIGITRQHLLNDAYRFSPRLIETLNAHGVLDQLIRLQLADFYYSADTQAIMTQHIGKS